MFNEIEKEYKKGLQEKRFFAYYWPRAIVVVLLAFCADFILMANSWIVYGVMVIFLILFVVIFFVRDFSRMKKLERRAGNQPVRGARAKIAVYLAADDQIRIDNLIEDLRKHHIHTKADLELALNYFERQLPVNSRPNLLEWTLSVAVALSSVIFLAYDTATKSIDFDRFLSNFGFTMAIALVILTPFILAKLISARISASRSKLDYFLVEDLTFLYINYDQFKHRLAP